MSVVSKETAVITLPRIKKNRMERRLLIEQKEIRLYVVLLLLITDWQSEKIHNL